MGGWNDEYSTSRLYSESFTSVKAFLATGDCNNERHRFAIAVRTDMSLHVRSGTTVRIMVFHGGGSMDR